MCVCTIDETKARVRSPLFTIKLHRKRANSDHERETGNFAVVVVVDEARQIQATQEIQYRASLQALKHNGTMMTPLEALEQYNIPYPQKEQDAVSEEDTLAPSETEGSEHPPPQEEAPAAPCMDDEEDKAPSEFICPLTLCVMTDPVMSRYGQSYEREAIIKWLSKGNKECPLTRQPLEMRNIIANHNLRLKIRRWELENDFDVKLVMDAPEDSSFNDEQRVFGYIDLNDHAERAQDDPRVILEYRGPPSAEEESRRSSTQQQQRTRQRGGRRTKRRGFLGRLRRAATATA